MWDFQGNIVGKWTNEPCSEVDEVVNHFWVLTIQTNFYYYFLSMKVGEALCSDPRWLLQAPACSFSFSDGGNGPKGALNGESSSMVS